VIKHMNPCGLAVADSIGVAYRLAYECDIVSAFGGVVAVNRPLDRETAEQIVQLVTHVVIAPEVRDDAMDVLARRRSMIVLAAMVWLPLRVVAGIGVVLILGHNLLDGIHPHPLLVALPGPGALNPFGKGALITEALNFSHAFRAVLGHEATLARRGPGNQFLARRDLRAAKRRFVRRAKRLHAILHDLDDDA